MKEIDMTADANPSALHDDADLDPNSLAAIRDLMASEDPVTPKPVHERMAEKAATAQAPVRPSEPAAMTAPVQPEPAAAALPPLTEQAPKKKRFSLRKSRKAPKAKAAPKPQAAPTSVPQGDGLMDRLRGYRPTPKHIAIAAAVLLVLFRPWLVFGVFFLMAFITVGIFLILGYDGFWRQVMSVARWYAGRRPSRSAEIHRKLDSFAMKFDAFLDRFPEGSVDGLYLPDFADLAQAEARHDEALDRRFDTLRESDA